MAELVYTPPTPEDVAELAANLRAADAAELDAATGGDPLDIIETAVGQSISPAAVHRRGELTCIYGVVPVSPMGRVGVPWLLGTDRLFDIPVELTRGARQWLGQVTKTFPRLVNYVDQRNTRSVVWLRRVGFTVDAPKPYGRLGLPFHCFHMGY